MATPDAVKTAEAVPREFLPILHLSRVLADLKFEEVRAKVDSGEYPSESVALARRLVEEAILTDYQARRLLKNRGAGLANDRYVILDCIGSGGMGNVYRARHRLMGRTVALKLISAERMSSPSKVARFQREMRLVSRLDHPHVVRALDADQFDGVPCLVMEYVPGQDLERRLHTRGPVFPAKATRYAAQAALGLAHAHEQGIIHRDIKPSNLLVGEGGQIKVLDFGVGALMESWDDSDSHQTVEGMVCGTADYMSPEQVTCRKMDGRSDLYSLGCTLYRMLSGQLPFPGDSKIERLAARVNGRPVPITDLLPGLHPGLVRALDRLIASEPEDRFPTASDAAEALLALTVPKGSSSPAQPGAHRRGPTPSATNLLPSSPRAPVIAPPHSPVDTTPETWPSAGPLSGETRSSSDSGRREGPFRGGTSTPTPDPNPLASYRNHLERSGATSGREVEPGYLAEVARINQMEIDRLSRELKEARQKGGEEAGRDVELTDLRELGMTLLEDHWPKLVLVAVAACVLSLVWLLSKAIG
jgi:eukaryotic-like serine/threonine-protein kinase